MRTKFNLSLVVFGFVVIFGGALSAKAPPVDIVLIKEIKTDKAYQNAYQPMPIQTNHHPPIANRPKMNGSIAIDPMITGSKS